MAAVLALFVIAGIFLPAVLTNMYRPTPDALVSVVLPPADPALGRAESLGPVLFHDHKQCFPAACALLRFILPGFDPLSAAIRLDCSHCHACLVADVCVALPCHSQSLDAFLLPACHLMSSIQGTLSSLPNGGEQAV